MIHARPGRIAAAQQRLFAEELGERIRVARMREGLTQNELARRAGIASGTMCLFEAGDRQPNAWTLARVAEVLDCSVEELVPITTAKEGV